MLKLFGHKCGQTELKCFDCRKPICRDCLVQLPSSLVCQKCNPRKKKSVIKAPELVQLNVASIFYSFVAFATLSFLSSFAGTLALIFAAVLGVVIAEALNKISVSMSRNAQLGIVALGVFIGAFLGCGMQYAVQGDWERAVSSLLSEVFSFIIVLIAIFVRFRRY